MKEQTIRELEERLRQLEGQHPSLAGRIRVYFETGLEQFEEQEEVQGPNQLSASHFLQASVLN
jgi:hypothetical protein